jgi:hypothetical protein
MDPRGQILLERGGSMKSGRTILWAVIVVLVLLLFVAISIPNLLRSKGSANEANLASKLRTAQTIQMTEQAKFSLDPAVAAPEKKLIHNAELGLMVGNLRAAVEQIQQLTESNHGEIDKLEITETTGGRPSATLLVRVPASGLRSAIAEFKKTALRTEREQISTVDVTREFYDNEAHMRNLHAEEQQYLTILKQARTVKDTLEVSEKLSGVRDRIERLQTQTQLMTHDIEMSLVTIVLMQEPDGQTSSARWRPLYDLKVAVSELFTGLGEWLDWVVAIVIKLPLIILWIVTAGAIFWICWRSGRYIWGRFLKPKVAKAQ